MAEKPTSSSTTYTTLGAPSGALGGSKGDQSGTESRMSTLILPLNGSLITLSSDRSGGTAPIARRLRAEASRSSRGATARASSRWDETMDTWRADSGTCAHPHPSDARKVDPRRGSIETGPYGRRPDGPVLL